MKNFKIIALTLILMINTTAFALDEKAPVQEAKPMMSQVPTTSASKPKGPTEEAKPTTSQPSITTSGTIKEPAEFQKVIEEYKKYISKIPVEVREEVITYRKEIAKINKQKRLLYRKLSQASQDYLKEEQEYKKRLPINRKSLINVDR